MSLIPKASKLLKPELKLEAGTLTIHYYTHKYFQNTHRYIHIYNTSIWICDLDLRVQASTPNSKLLARPRVPPTRSVLPPPPMEPCAHNQRRVRVPLHKALCTHKHTRVGILVRERSLNVSHC